MSAEAGPRLPDAFLAPGEEEFDRSLRPKDLSEFIGQEQIKEQLAIFLEAARARGEPCEHVLLAGPPGLGKTSLANIIAKVCSATAIAFAFYLGDAAGFHGEELLTSGWVKTLDCRPSEALDVALDAKRIGLLDLRVAGDVFDLNLQRLDPKAKGAAR